MRITKKLIKLGRSNAVTIPQLWLADQARQNGQPVTEVVMEVNGKIIITAKK